MSERFDVVVVGGGHNGLTAATLLAARGRKTLVLERRDVLGGLAAGEEFHPGYRTDGVLHETAALRGRLVEKLALRRHGLELVAEERPILALERHGPGLTLWRDPGRMGEELAERSPADAGRYREYRRFLDRLAPVVRRLTDRPPPDLFDTGLADLLQLARSGLALRRLGGRDMMEVLRAAPTCVADWLDEWFEDDLLKASLAAPALWATWTGPRSPGSTANLLLAECTYGRPVVGGPRALVVALEKAARAGGVEIRTGARVAELAVRDGRVRGVVLRGGEEISCAAVAASCDPRRLFLRHLPPAQLSLGLERDIGNYRARGTTAKVNLALSGYPELAGRPGHGVAAFRVGESLEEIERAFDAVKYRRFSERPVLEVRIPTVENPALAPEGHHVASILVHFAPYELEGGWSDERNEALNEATIRVLEDHAPGIRDLVVGRQVLSPADLETRYGVTGGHLYHGEHALDQLLVRPTPGCARHATPIGGLYLCGSGSHPGGGITCAPGALGARALLASR